MTTIKLKNGSGAPTAGDLVQGEPALDLTNKRLYTEDSGGTVIEVGTNPTSITTGDITATGTVSFANLSTTGDITFGDNDKAVFGAGSDLQIYHDGSNSYVQDSGTGDLWLAGTQVRIANAAGDKTNLYSVDGGQVSIRYNGAEKLATTATGIDVTGTVTANNLTLSDSTPVLTLADTDGTNQLLQLQEASGSGYIDVRNNVSYANLFFRRRNGTDTLTTMRIKDNGDVILHADDGTSQDFYWDASASRLGLGETNPSHELHIKSDSPQFRLQDSDGTNTYGDIQFNGTALSLITRGGASSHGVMRFKSTNGTDTLNRLEILSNGDVLFYDDTGSSGGRWDASANSLGIGTASPSVALDVHDSGDATIRILSTGTGVSDDTILRSQISGTTASNYLYFGDADDNNSGQIRYVHSDDSMRFYAGATTERFRLYSTASIFYNGTTEIGRFHSNNNFGINNSAPDTSLHIGDISATNATGNGRIKIEDTSTGLASAGGLEFVTSAFGSGYGWKVNSIDSGGGVHLDFGTRQNSTTWSHKLRFANNGTVAIGDTTTNNTANRLKVQGSQGDDRIAMSTASTASSAHIEAQVKNYWSGATYTGTAIVQNDSAVTGTTAGISNANLGVLRFQNTSNALIYTNGSTPIHFGTVGTNRMTLDTSGNLLVGITAGSARLHIKEAANKSESDAHIRIEGSGYSGFHWLDATAYYIGQNSTSRAVRIYSGAETAGVALTNGSTSWSTFSDERLKYDVEPIENAIDSLSGLRTVKYRLDGVDSSDDKKKLGVIAQDLVGIHDEVLDPMTRSGDDTEYMGVRYTELVPVLIKAIQEQQEIIDNLESRIEQLEGAN